MKIIQKFAVPIILLFLFILFTIGTVVYTTIRNEIGINSNDKIILEVEKAVKENRVAFQQITDFLTQLKTYSRDFKIELINGRIQYYSYTDREESNISFEEYQAKYYNGIPHDTSPCYVADFELPKELFQSFLSGHHLKEVRVRELCGQKTISFNYKYRHFYPINREIYLHFFSGQICDSIEVSKNGNPEWYNWVHGIDEHWLIESKRED